MGGLFLALYQYYGYMPQVWDSTYIHTPGVVPRFLMSALFMSGVAEYILIRFYSVWLTSYETPSLRYDQYGELEMRSAIKNVCMFTAYLMGGYRRRLRNLAMMYLMKHYLVLITIFAAMLLLTLGSVYTFMIPYVLRIPFIDDIVWGYRFRVLTVQLITIPLIIGNLIVLCIWPKSTINSDNLDPIFRLKVYKDMRRHWFDKEYQQALAPIAVLLDKITSNNFTQDKVKGPADLLKASHT